MTDLSALVTTVHRYRDLQVEENRGVVEFNEQQVRSLPSLLETPDAPELVLSFLNESHDNILWLSDEFCISSNSDLEARAAANIGWFISVRVNLRRCFELFGLRSSELSSLVPVVDALVQLLAWHKSLSEVQLWCNPNRNFATVPVSIPALETLVGQAESPRTLDFVGVALSAEQCRVLAFSCNENIKLIVHGSQLIASLTEALTLNQSPEWLFITEPTSLPDEVFNAFLTALEVNTSLLGLDVNLVDVSCTRKCVALLRAIGRNKGLQCLGLGHFRLSDAEWKILWEESLSRHPKIRALNIENTLPYRRSSDMQRRDEVMVRSIRTNTVLTKIGYSDAEHSPNTMDEEVLPILQVNRFRPLVQAIKKEKNAEHRGKLFAMTLMRDQVVRNNRPAFCYLLLKENPDLLVQSLPTRGEQLRRRWNQSFARLSAAELEVNAVEEEMEECGEDLPPLPHTYSMLARKKRKR